LPAAVFLISLTILPILKSPSISAILVAAVLVFGACDRKPSASKVADVDGLSVTAAEFNKQYGRELSAKREELYKFEEQKLNEYIGAILLTKEAKSRNVSVSTLLEQEVNDKVAPVSEQQIRRFYDANKDRLQVELEKVHDQIRDYLRDKEIQEQKNSFLKTLRSKAKITTYLKRPAIYRAEVPIDGAPIRGTNSASVAIVKFEDFQCPFCKSVQPTFQELLKKYDGKVRVVHKDLPLEAIHPFARQAAEAARCAGEQGKFWGYHDQLYMVSPKLSTEDLKSSAKQVGLNSAEFDQCLTSGKYRAAVQKDLNDGAQLGLTGTPAFFINGREMSGAQPLEAFAAVIDEELGQTR
jgi:protein-disulfide isomerase